MADNASVPKNPPNSITKNAVSDPELPTSAASVGPDKERNKADQQRQAAESSKTVTQNANSVNAEKSGTSGPDRASVSQGNSEPAEQEATPISQKTTVSAGQRATPISQKTTASARQKAALISQKTTASAEQRAAPISQKTTVSAKQRATPISQRTTGSVGQRTAPTDYSQKNSLLLKKKNAAEPMQKRIAGQSNRIGKNGKMAPSDKQKLQTIDRVLYCDQANLYNILNIQSSATQKQTQQAFGRIIVLTNSNKLSNSDQKLVKQATEAHKRA